jgi:hypothetical protein
VLGLIGTKKGLRSGGVRRVQHFLDYPDKEINEPRDRARGCCRRDHVGGHHATGVRVRELPIKIEDLLCYSE